MTDYHLKNPNQWETVFGAQYDGPEGLLRFLLDELQRLRTDLDGLRTVYNAHVHSGITAGAANSGAPTTTQPALTVGTFVPR